jgi:hypothetical protein
MPILVDRIANKVGELPLVNLCGITDAGKD